MGLKTKEVDVLIIGAGISGIGAAYHLQQHCPNKSFTIIEARSEIGGTWDLFRYPGIRSDSDMFTFGFHFKPWRSPKAISPGADIRRYIKEAASENGIKQHIEFEHKVHAANWHSASAKWHVVVKNLQTGETYQYVCNFFFSAAGYYNYEQGYTPKFKGVEQFKGEIIHPQHWPKSCNYADKKIIVIGSGATAVTLVPALAKTAKHVIMLQRSPTYIASRPEQDKLANLLSRYLPAKFAYSVNRWRKILENILMFSLARRRPKWIKKIIRKGIVDVLGKDYPVDKHFKPRYQPWDQRACLVPDNDLFYAIKNQTVSMVTEHIDCFTANGIKLRSGEEIVADIIVTATGLNLEVLGNYQLTLDHQPFNAANSFVYKGMMLSGLPNYAFSIGYTNASWTLKSDLVGQYVCRLLNYMDKHQHQYCQPVVPQDGIDETPLIDFSSGYITRSSEKMPKQGTRKPWKLHQNYILDKLSLSYGSVLDDCMQFDSVKPD